MATLSGLKDFTMVRGARFPIEDAVWIARYFGRPPLPGLHFLADYRGVLKATRRLMDAIIDLACAASGPAAGTRIIYSPDSILSLPTLRQLYPDALHVHLVRDISHAPLRMAAAAGLPARRLCERWRRSERAFLDVPPLPNQVTIRYEDLLRAPGETMAAFARVAGLPVTAADQDAVTEQFPPGGPGAPAGGLRGRLAARCAAVYCHAELAALHYRASPGRPGSLRTLAAMAGLAALSRGGASPRRPGAGGSRS
jgi:Sulfotransferase family